MLAGGLIRGVRMKPVFLLLPETTLEKAGGVAERLHHGRLDRSKHVKGRWKLFIVPEMQGACRGLHLT